MALTIETGAIVPNANSYATVQQLRDFASARGITVPADDADCEHLLVKACDYIGAQEHRFKGTRVSSLQPLSWPRNGVYLFGTKFANDAIPVQVIAGQCQLAVSAQTTDLLPSTDPSASRTKREKVGPLETEYFSASENAGNYSQPIIAAADAIMAELYKAPRFSISVGRA